VTRQYDHFVMGNSVLVQPEDSGVLHIDEKTNLGIALSTDANGRYTYLNPYLGAQLALCEAYRNVACVGAEPVAITDCLNFGTPEDPEVMWQFLESILGLVDGCQEFGTPVTGGNVSFYNQTGSTNILPTPVVGMLGVMDDVSKRTRQAFVAPGHQVFLLGETKEELSGSVWEDVIHSHLGGMPPSPNFAAEKGLAAVLQEAATEGVLASAHDLSEGGLGQALTESCLGGSLGATVTLPDGFDATTQLFSESPARALVSLDTENVGRLQYLCTKHSVALCYLGQVSDDALLQIMGQFEVGLDELRTTWERPIPEAMSRA
jgi:phosphoribosylformylglycinamidine synthase